ncbi:hypothetical protein BCV70DRAFT_88676 [Testicularia cyperi]|uniref:Uncharacterized protein n=1 Tax=Testicularia cyperi TaxID=1882483 RepID=A0A317XRP5_9BASI|nr:hypothetical protein BCV70DRAFT_88676 [Testicularia cyperi]
MFLPPPLGGAVDVTCRSCLRPGLIQAVLPSHHAVQLQLLYPWTVHILLPTLSCSISNFYRTHSLPPSSHPLRHSTSLQDPAFAPRVLTSGSSCALPTYISPPPPSHHYTRRDKQSHLIQIRLRPDKPSISAPDRPFDAQLRLSFVKAQKSSSTSRPCQVLLSVRCVSISAARLSSPLHGRRSSPCAPCDTVSRHQLWDNSQRPSQTLLVGLLTRAHLCQH